MSANKAQKFIPPELQEQWLIKKSRESFYWFCYFVSGFEHKPSPIHKEWIDAMVNPKNRFINISAFPGCAKTTYLQYYLAWRIGRYPHETHLILSASDEQAKQRLEAVRDIIFHNDPYKLVFPHIYIDSRKPKTTQQFTVASKKWNYLSEREMDYTNYRTSIAKFGDLKEPTIYACGITSKRIIGKRISGCIVMDDIHDKNNTATEEQRHKIYQIVLQTVLSRLKPDSNSQCINICNRWHENDTAGRLMELKRADGSSVWFNITTPIRDENGKPTWEEVWYEQRIVEKAEEVGGESSPIWQLLYMIRPSAMGSGEIRWDDLKKELPDPLPKFKEIVISVDFAHTQSITSDYTVYTAVARDEERPFNMYVLACERMKLSSVSEKINNLVMFYQFVSDVYGEVRYIVFEDRDSAPELQYLQSQRPEIPVTSVKIRTDKEQRLRGFAGYTQVGRVYFNTSMSAYYPMISELVDFPSGKHDDICDTLSLVWMLPDWVNVFGHSGIIYAREKAELSKGTLLL